MDKAHKDALFTYLLRLGDSQLVLSHRLSQWCGHAPELELDIALANIGLDILGQARTLLTMAGELEGQGRDEDRLAFFRDEREFCNLLLCEQPNGDFARTLMRQWWLDNYHQLLFSALTQSGYAPLAAFAAKSLKEVNYHLRFSSGWIQRLGLGTEESHQRTQAALDELWRFTGELFATDEVEATLVAAGILPGLDELAGQWRARIEAGCRQAELTLPAQAPYRQGGRQGLHTEHLGYLLAEMQSLPRSLPNVSW
ncbi:phenylacetate-CoA oxygenase subunit PaaI [Zobellella denitrificans]|jgi:ring-1,2-phenylacetyl-CoA epoxidase subunit PaaC|uniref:Phenylacetic acid degradation protein n=1 Tax=Zobellella denitrificans TaxID=347534 RepID=A0A231MWJ7_9GAMM|nr:1,2-phenylacetyl-CoA epoxidase subunit PaaC [Zobellella denitrificans]ATG74592.1 phenylacetic acid degradation protein [Zobellella denitrificans]OXS14603.1 phenylacetate-CoA oxygenase subunit PaaI [Zobellella denitrificans]